MQHLVNPTRISTAMSRYGSYVSDTLLQIEHFTERQNWKKKKEMKVTLLGK